MVVGSIVISLDSEFIENEKMLNENEKQDCEVKAFKRMVTRIKKNYPKYTFIITGDGLYATTPIINICKKYNWFYIFNLKPERLKSINEMFEDNIKYNNETSRKNYYLSSNIEFKENFINVFKYIEVKKKQKITFKYISNLKITNNNIKEIVSLGRKG